MLLLATSLLAAVLAQDATASSRPPRPAQRSVQIPLTGTLPLRCNARVVRAEGSPSFSDRITLVISHSCNAEHIIQFTSPVLDEAVGGAARITFDGAEAHDRGRNSVSFLEPPGRERERRLLISAAGPSNLARLTAPGAVTITLAPR
jgi:hypothetical protein